MKNEQSLYCTFYASPEVKVINISPERPLLAGSDGNIDDGVYGEEDDD